MGTEPRHPVKVGDIFEGSWGYDQTNLDYFVVVEVLPASVRVQQCGKDHAGGSRVRPAPERVFGEIYTKRVDVGEDGRYICIVSPVYGHAYLMKDPTTAHYQTPVGEGH